MVSAALITAVLVAAPRSALPAEYPGAIEARAHCAAGRVEPAIELLARIVAETGDPNAVFNQGRCYQQNGRPVEALARFQEYRRTTRGLTKRQRAEVDRHIRELAAIIKAAARPPAPGASAAAPALPRPATAAAPSPIAAAASTPALAAPPPPPLPVEPNPAVAAASPSPEAAAAPGESASSVVASRGRSRRSRIGATVLAAAGLVGIGTGAFFSWEARKTQIEIEDQRGLVPNSVFQDRMSRGRRAETLQWIGYGVGAAALVGSGAVLLFSRPSRQEPAVTTAVVADPAGAAVLVQGRF